MRKRGNYDIIKIEYYKTMTNYNIEAITRKEGKAWHLKKQKILSMKLKKRLEHLAKKDNQITELRVISYNNYKPKLDLHKWEVNEDSEKMLRGLTLTDDEAKTLLEALKEYFKRPKED